MLEILKFSLKFRTYFLSLYGKLARWVPLDGALESSKKPLRVVLLWLGCHTPIS